MASDQSHLFRQVENITHRFTDNYIRDQDTEPIMKKVGPKKQQIKISNNPENDTDLDNEEFLSYLLDQLNFKQIEDENIYILFNDIENIDPFYICKTRDIKHNKKQFNDYKRLINALIKILGNQFIQSLLDASTLEFENIKVIPEKRIYDQFNHYGCVFRRNSEYYYKKQIKMYQEALKNDQITQDQKDIYTYQIQSYQQTIENLKNSIAQTISEKLEKLLKYDNINKIIENIKQLLPEETGTHCICCAAISAIYLIQHNTTGKYYYIGSTCQKEWYSQKYQPVKYSINNLQYQILCLAVNDRKSVCFVCGQEYTNKSEQDPYKIPVHKKCRGVIAKHFNRKVDQYQNHWEKFNKIEEFVIKYINAQMAVNQKIGQELMARFLVYKQLMDYDCVKNNIQQFIRHCNNQQYKNNML